ncbi:rhodanese-like domain-containing protein [Halegenticoccus tardaugens]|uniref:rhodanese-like domain-containing protein n=1 Tax=Halegenticoccus tardaugens TaxID=2071624 RepID=UPI00100BA4BB
MNRRTFLTTFGGITILSGCAMRPPNNQSTVPNNTSSEMEESATIQVDGTNVPLVPLSTAIKWYRSNSAHFVDARSYLEYQRSHIKGAVLSPAPDGQPRNDPVVRWARSAKIVTYCGCPHHLSSLRAATLIDQRFQQVFALDEGFWAWMDSGYPVEGTDVTTNPNPSIIQGIVPPRFAGNTVWARHDSSGQREATAVTKDGLYELELRFTNVGATSLIYIETPAYTLIAPLSRLTKGTIKKNGTIDI